MNMDVLPVGFWVVAMLVVLALLFDFMNGFHDAANSIATVVSTGVLKPHQAVAFAAFFNVVAIMIFQLKVAATIGKGIVEPGIVDQHAIDRARPGLALDRRREGLDIALRVLRAGERVGAVQLK